MKALRHLTMFIVLVIIVFGLRLLGHNYYSKDLAKVIGKASVVRALEIQSGWKSQGYVSLDSNAQSVFIRKARQQELGLSDLQISKLELKLEELLHYFAQPTFEQYYRLKTDGLHYQFIPHSVLSNRVAVAQNEGKLIYIKPGPVGLSAMKLEPA